MSERRTGARRPASAWSWQDAGTWLSSVVLCAAVVIAPVCLGATAAWVRFAVEATLAFVTLTWCICGRPTVWQLLAPCGALLLAAVQVMPLSATLASSIAPISAGAWLVANAETGSSGVRISMDPAATILSAARLFLGLATALAVAAAARREPVRRAFFIAMATTCVVIWTLGLAFPVRGTHRSLLGFVSIAGPLTHWLDPRLAPVQTSGCSRGETITAGDVRYIGESGTPGDGFGPYISTNQFAGGMCLTCPFVLTAWMWSTRRRLPAAVRQIGFWILLAAAVATTGYLAQSRAGSVAVAMAGLVVWMLSVEARWARWAARTVVASCAVFLLAFAGILYTGRPELVDWIPEPLGPPLAAAARDVRGSATRLAVRMFLASPVAGIGLGCFEPVCSHLKPGDLRFNYAHNDYAQYLAETGLLGVLYVAALVGLTLRASRRSGNAGSPERDPVRTAAWAALAGIAAHSGFDWNLHLPANALLASVAAGLVLPAGILPGALRPTAAWGAAAARGSVVVIALAALGLLLRDAVAETAQRRLRDAIVADRRHQQDPAAPEPAALLAAAITAAEPVAGLDPGNSRLALLIGQATLHAAAGVEDTPERERLRQSATAWFRKARASRPFRSGLPQ